ncbi:hypothetical protein C0431_12775 [bacterium]|nr:hypothetical protein [bacterium]
MSDNAEVVTKKPFIQKEAYYLDDLLNIVHVKFSFFNEADMVRVKMEGHRFGARSEEDITIDDRILDRETLFAELNQRIEKHLKKLGPLDVQVAPLDCLIRAAVPDIPGIHRFIDIFGGDITVNGKRHTLTRTRLTASLEGIHMQASSIVPLTDSEDSMGNLENISVYLNGARSYFQKAQGIQQSTVRQLDDFNFFRFHGLSTGFTVDDSFLVENEERTEAAKKLLRIPHDMQFRDYVLPSRTDLLELIASTRESDAVRIRTAHKRGIDIDLI